MLRPATLRAALLGLLLCLLVGAQPARAAVPRDFFGLEAKDIYAFGQAYRDAELPKVQAAGVGVMRQEFIWRTIETSPGKYNFAKQDAFVRDAAKHGIEVMPVLVTTPAFRSPDPGGSEMTPPTNYADLGDFGAVVSKRYGPNGTFWSANPTVPKVPVRQFQIWNEPNIPRFWPAGVNPAQYAAMLKAVYPRIKAADPGAEVITAGISEPQNVCCMPLRDFITKMYQAGAKGSFDTLAIHPYWSTAAGSIALVEATRAIMTTFGDTGASVRISEIGWSTGGTPYMYNQSEAGQATQLRTLFTELAQRRAELHVRGIVWSIWTDQPSSQDWAQYTGLERADRSPKPSYLAYRQVAAGDEGTPSDPSGNSNPGEPGSAAPGKLVEAAAVSRLLFSNATFARGTKVGYFLNEAATVRFTVTRTVRGRRVKRGKRTVCAKPTKRNRKAKACTRVVTLRGSLTRTGVAGNNSFRFTGRLNGRKLKPGRYRLVATPSVEGRQGKATSTGFRIVR